MSSPAWQFQMGDPDVLNGAVSIKNPAMSMWSSLLIVAIPIVITKILESSGRRTL